MFRRAESAWRNASSANFVEETLMRNRVSLLRLGLLGGLLVHAPLLALASPPAPATESEIRQLVADAREKSTEDFNGADHVVLLDEADVYVQPSGLATTEQCQVIKLLTPAAVRAQCVQRFDFDPATRRVTVKALRIHRADGTIEEVPLDDIVTQPTVQRWIFWGGEQHLLTVPRLRVGDAIELRVSKIGFNIAYLDGAGPTAGGETLQPPMPGHWYEVTLFQARHPIVRKRYSVHMPEDMPVQYEVYNGALKTSLWFGEGTLIHTFSAEDIPAVKSEPHMVALDDCVPKVVMATLPTWELKSQWFHQVNDGQFEADDAIRKTVAEITAGLTDLDDKIAACNHWVADNIRYYGTSRGPCEGFTLHKSVETFRDRGGVCKDKAGMLVTMLRVLGVEAYPALTMAGSRVEAIPADQFNHTVTVMRDTDGDWRILDPTWIPLSREMWSSREALQGLVYGTPDGETLTLSPYYSPDYNRLHCRAEGKLLPDGSLATRVSMELSGYPDTYFRRSLDRDRREPVAGVFEQVVNISPQARVTNVSFTEPYDYSQDAVVAFDVEAPAYAAASEAVTAFRLPLMTHPLADWLIPDLFYDFSQPERGYGLRMRATRGLRYSESIQLPAGWEIQNPPAERNITSPAADLRFTATADGSELRYTFELDIKKQIIPPEEYPAFREAIEAMHALADTWIACTQPEPANGGPRHAALNRPQQEARHD
jgi:hypothetical protein